MNTASLLVLGQGSATAPRHLIVRVDGVMGGRPVIRGTRITVASVKGRISGGDSIEDLMVDYPDVPRAAFEAAVVHEEDHETAEPRPPRPIR